MLKKILFLAFVLSSFTSNSQVNEGLTAEERAYLFHIVKKSPILDNSLGRYFDYKGEIINLPNKQMNYDSVELIIINQPELLIIRKEEISKSSKGILAEAANKMALWELNKVLLAKRGSEKELAQYSTQYAAFEEYLMEKLPAAAFKEKDGISKPSPKLDNLLNPSLSFLDKVAFIETLRFKSPDEEKQTVDAISYAVNKYVEKRTLEIFHSLGGKSTDFSNILVAAGDGSSTSGMLDEREKDEKGRWNKGLPKAVGFFPYQTRLVAEKKELKLESMTYAIIDEKTVGKNQHTNLHFDVWGYNTEKQTTVVIEKNGLSYPLFGSGDTRFLSPDSSFSNGTTFMAIIKDLESNKIAKLNEMIYGKKGFDYWIDYNKKKKDETELKIEKNEYEYSALHNQSMGTDNKSVKKTKKSKKHITHPDADKSPPVLTNYSDKKDKKKSEGSIVGLYDLFEAYKKKIAELETQKAEAIDLMAIYQQKLDLCKQLIGARWATYSEKDGFYTFQDSSTFDMLTQDFQFQAKPENEDFEIRLLAIPESSLSKNADEVMLHINKTEAKPNFDARLQIELNDIFASDSWTISNQLIRNNDSVAVRQFFEAMLDKKTPFSIIARGQGVGKWDGSRTIKELHPVELGSYPGSSAYEKQKSRQDATFQRLRVSEIFIQLNRSILVEINSYTDPVSSSITVTNADQLALMKQYKLSKNDLLSAYRSAEILRKLKTEVNYLAGTFLGREEAGIVIDRFNKEFAKARISIGATSIKLSEL
ncbi:MAG: hypothetical protein NWR53_09095 [Crocinitomicaceae bacterium]|nr:hypothetical protein [Crocinitomicaceae bacterium]